MVIHLSWAFKNAQLSVLQLDLIRHSALTISHGGLNTALDSPACSVPMVTSSIARSARSQMPLSAVVGH